MNSDLATLTDADGTTPSDTITLNATDSLGNAAGPGGIAVTLTALLPVLTAPVTVTVAGATATAIGGVSLTETGSVAGETFTITLADTSGDLSATGTGVSGSGSTTLTMTGSLAAVKNDLATLADTDGTTPSDTIVLTVADSLGNTGAATSIAVTVTPLVPVLTAPSAAAVTEANVTSIGGVSLGETGSVAGEIFTLTLADTNGDLSATGSGVSGSGTRSLTITGSLAAVNNDLATLTDTDATTTSDTIALNASDNLGNTSAAKSIAVTVTPLVPVLTAPGTATVSQATSTTIGGVSLGETGSVAGEIFTVALADTHGDLSATGSGVSGSGTTSLTIAGSLAAVNGDLATLTDTDGTTPSDTIRLTAEDSLGNTGAADSISVTVKAPVQGNPGNAVYIGPPVNAAVYVIGPAKGSSGFDPNINLAAFANGSQYGVRYNAANSGSPSNVTIIGTGNGDSINLGSGSNVLAEESRGNNIFTFGSGANQKAVSGSGNDTFVLSSASLNGFDPTIEDFHGAGTWYTSGLPHDFIDLIGFQNGAQLAYDPVGSGGETQNYFVAGASGTRISSDFAVQMGDGTANHLSRGDYSFAA